MTKLNKLGIGIIGGIILLILAIPSLDYIFGDSKIVGVLVVIGWLCLAVCAIYYTYCFFYKNGS
jgi:hypothetical protein